VTCSFPNKKRCPVCKRLLPRTRANFHADPVNRDGLRNECRPCRGDRRSALYHGAKRFHPWQRRRSGYSDPLGPCDGNAGRDCT